MPQRVMSIEPETTQIQPRTSSAGRQYGTSSLARMSRFRALPGKVIDTR